MHALISEVIRYRFWIAAWAIADIPIGIAIARVIGGDRG